MEHLKRSERVAVITRMLSDSPGRRFTLKEFAEYFDCAKSTLSEDIGIVRSILERYGLGMVETLNGAAGGVQFLPFSSQETDFTFVQSICDILCAKERLLPGGYLYTADVFSDPKYLKRIGEIFAKHFYRNAPDVVVTVEAMGVPVALMVANALGKPLVTARRGNRLTEGSVVTLNYMSASSQGMETMSLSRRSLEAGQRALIIDDFMKGGGSARALENMMQEFGVAVAGVGVIVATREPAQKRVKEYCSLLVLGDVDEETGTADLSPADWLKEK